MYEKLALLFSYLISISQIILKATGSIKFVKVLLILSYSELVLKQGIMFSFYLILCDIFRQNERTAKKCSNREIF